MQEDEQRGAREDIGRFVRWHETAGYYWDMDAPDAARKVARFEKTLNPRDLWEVSERAFAAAMREITRVVSARLVRPERQAALEVPIPGGEAALGPAAFASGLGPLLGFWIETNDLVAPPGVASLLAAHLDHGRRRAAKLRAELGSVAAIFHDAGLEATVLKGMHTGWTYFPEAGTRPLSDIDLLIPHSCSSEAFRLLTDAGFRLGSSVTERSTWWPPGKHQVASVQLTHADNPWSLDLHVSLDRQFPSASAPARFGVLQPEDRRAWRVGGTPVWVLTHPLLACYLLVHASQDFPYLPTVRLVELLLVFQRDGGAAFPWAQLADRLRQTGTAGFAYPALKLTEDLVPGTVSPVLLDLSRKAAPAAVRRVLARTMPAATLQMYRRSVEGRFLWAGSGWRRILALLAWAWPRDGRGGRLPVREALHVTGLRVRRLIAGRFRWRAG